MQSGISASQELQDAFRTLVSSPGSQRGLYIEIQKEHLVPGAVIPTSSGDDFYADIESISRQLAADKATYIILRRGAPSEHDSYVAVTYVPDAAPVRQKMLFASTRLAMVRELGAERFRESIFATDPKELTVDGWKAHEAHVDTKAPLTEEELGQQTLKEAEDEEGSRIGTGGRRSHVLGAGMAIDSGVEEALSALTSGNSENLVQLKLDVAREAILLVGSSSVQPGGLTTAISSTEPRYSFYRFEHDFEGEKLAPVVFIYTCPTESKVKERMVYASSRKFVSEQLANQSGLKVEKRLEASSPSDFTEKAIWEEFHPPVQAKAAFSRPKRPGKR